MVTPPQNRLSTAFADEEKARINRLVHLLGLGLLVSGAIGLVHNAWAADWVAVYALGCAELCVGVALWLNSRGALKTAIYLIIFVLISGTSALVFTSEEGTRDATLLGYAFVLVLAGLWLDSRSFIGVTLMVLVCAGVVFIADFKGFLSTYPPLRPPIGALINLILLLLLTALAIGLLGQDLRASLARSRLHEKALLESGERLRQLANATFEGILISENNQILQANQQLADLLRCDLSQLLGANVLDPIAPESRPLVLEHFVSGSEESYEVIGLRKDGTRFPAEVRGRSVVYEGRKVRVSVMRDVTQRRQQEKVLRESEERFRRIFEEGPLGMALSAPDFRFLRTNEAFCRMLGYSDQELRSMTFKDITHPDHLAGDVESLKHLVTGEISRYRTEKRYLHKNGAVLWASATIAPVHDANGNFVHFLAMVEDVTDRKNAEQRLAQSHEQLRALSSRLQSLREEERTWIAREIHDNLGQLLTALKLDVFMLQRKLSAVSDPELRAAMQDKISSVRELTDETIVSVQKIATELRPGILDRLGLIAALESQTRNFQSRTGLAVSWKQTAAPLHLPPEVATGIFRIYQEILTNVARHSKASEVTVQLTREAGNLLLQVTDNGVGIRQADLENPHSLGLLGLKERATMLGGKVSFGPNPDKGTKVLVQIPLAGKEDQVHA